jgi:putative tributyrin esterase
MALIEFRMQSEILGRPFAMFAIVPDSGAGPFPVLYLLHGLLDDYTHWLRRTRVEVYLRDRPIIVVMPDGHRSFYANAIGSDGPDARGGRWGDNARYMDHLTHEVISQAERLLPVKRTRGGRAIGGLSMGGYGAMLLALTYPNHFASVHSHSGALLCGTKSTEGEPADFRRVFGKNASGTDLDLFVLAHRCKQNGKLPRILLDCGTEDFLLNDNRQYHLFLQQIGVPHEYREYPGAHDWNYWDAHVAEAIDFHLSAMRVKRPK